MKINIKRTDNDFAMEATNDTGNTLMMDGSEGIGGHNKGMRPMQLLLSAVGGCTAIDVISILKKQKQNIETFEIEVDGDSEKKETYSYYKTIKIKFIITGDVDEDKAKKAAALSHEKYCSVSKALEYSSKVTYEIELNGKLI
jgi:putative redox protein